MSELLTIKEIAAMHRCSVKHARDILVKAPGFPGLASDTTGRTHRWRAQEVHNFLHRRPLDEPGAFHLYRHFDANGILLYVGVSLSTVARLGEHALHAHWFNRIARIEVARFHSRAASLKSEAETIRTEKPLYNIQHAKGKK